MKQMIYALSMVFLLTGLTACSEAANETANDASVVSSATDTSVPVVETVTDAEAVVVETPADTSEASETVATATDHLQDIEWILTRMDQSEPVKGSKITVTFAKNGGVYGTAGCNRYSGRYELDEQGLKINPALASTMMACAEDVMQQEHAYHQIFPDVTSWELAADGSLQLHGKDGEILVFVKQ